MTPHPERQDLSLAHFLYSLLLMAYFFSFFFRVSASVILPLEASRLGLSAGLAGFISSLYYYAYAVTQPLCGILHDRFGPLRVVAFGMALAGLGELVYVLSPTALSLGLWRLLTGLGLAPMFSGALTFQSHAFPLERYPLYAGLTIAMGNFGAVVSVGPLGHSLDRWGKEPVFTFLALVSFALALTLFLFRRKAPSVEGEPWATSLLGRLGEAARDIAASRRLLTVTILWTLLISSLLTFQGLWAVAWYERAFSVPLKTARNWATLIGVGVMIGTFLGGRFRGERLKLLRRSYVTAGILWIVLLAFTTWGRSMAAAGMAGFFLGMASGVFIVHGAAAINENARPGRRGAVLGMANMIIFIGVIAYQWGTGSLIGLFETAAGQYGPRGFLVAFGVTTALFWLGLLLFSGDREREGAV